MNNIRTVISLAIGALSLSGCSTIETNSLVQTLIKPIQQVRHGSDSEALYRMARSFQMEGRQAEAIKAYRQVLDANPRHAEAHNALGVIYSQQQQVELAEQQFQLALQIDPNLAHVHNNVGYHLMRNGRLNEALQALGRAHVLDRSNKAVTANMAEAQQAAERDAQSQVEQVAAAETAPETTVPAVASASVASTQATTSTGSQLAAPQALQAQVEPTLSLQLVSVDSNVWELKARARPSQDTVAAAPVPAPSETQAVVTLPAPSTPPTATQIASNPYVTTLPSRIEIANGNGTTGLALKVSRELMAYRGFERPRLTNHKPFDVRTTRIQYVAGAETAARRLNASLPKQVPLVRVASLDKNTTVRLLIGKDFPRQG
ncbi:MAG TPA: tetratricopeptide repeat protein [Aquabacterium sp.]|uniref:LytR C-terminal domain-containing protein n=1 Tax=Aquabacterium sp. TaxID=1872578 RepID=UPI002E3225AB|nr:tetratricopeptide repeat protein [Aquabacterium sp.]HEX5372288.1 tetratricopeptide repeat protein [Aquabacterium sp.]